MRRTAPADRTAARRPKRGEAEKARKLGRSEASRITLRRAVQTAAARPSATQRISATADDFLRALDQAGILVRLRHSEINPDQIPGYAVTLPDHHPNGNQRWYGGSHLADGLSWTRLQQRRTTPGAASAPDREPYLTHEERQAIYDDAARAAANATAHLRRYLAVAPHLARDACWAASDTLYVAAQATGNPHLRRAADAYDRAARPPYGRIPQPTPAGNGLRTAARILAITGTITDKGILNTMVMIANLLTLIDTITHLHQSQQREAQRYAARTAVTHMRRAASDLTGAGLGPQANRRPSAVDVAMTAFPAPWSPTAPTHLPGPSSSPLRAPHRVHEPGGRRPVR